ncbi:MAG: hypothetical protein K0S74_1474 [Chlamydiales bacterium]|jgi:hypothetical protein|nr:hypothetical protein [Chlamydiales bacterium]
MYSIKSYSSNLSEISNYIKEEPLDNLSNGLRPLSLKEGELVVLFSEVQKDLPILENQPEILIKLFQSLSHEQLSCEVGLSFIKAVKDREIFHYQKNAQGPILRICQIFRKRGEEKSADLLYSLTGYTLTKSTINNHKSIAELAELARQKVAKVQDDLSKMPQIVTSFERAYINDAKIKKSFDHYYARQRQEKGRLLSTQ